MEKVKLTQKQIDRVESLIKEWTYEFDRPKEEMVIRHLGMWKEERNRCLNELSVDDFCRVLYEPHSFEVMPEYSVGDWVVSNNTKKIAKITHIPIAKVRVWVDDTEIKYFTDYRRATQDEIQQEKERRWWKLHGRNPWELKERDVLTYKESDRTFNVDSVNGDTVVLENIKYGLKQIKQVFRVACFAEKRLDVSAE